MSFITTTSLLLSSFLMQTLAMPVAVPSPGDLILLSERAIIEISERATAVIERQPEAVAEPEAASPVELTIRAPAPVETLELEPGAKLDPKTHGVHAFFGESNGGGCAVM